LAQRAGDINLRSVRRHGYHGDNVFSMFQYQAVCLEGEIMAYRNVTLAHRTVQFIMSGGPGIIELRGHIERVRRYQSQHDVDSTEYRFWKEVGDQLMRIKFGMETNAQSSEQVIKRLRN